MIKKKAKAKSRAKNKKRIQKRKPLTRSLGSSRAKAVAKRGKRKRLNGSKQATPFKQFMISFLAGVGGGIPLRMLAHSIDKWKPMSTPVKIGLDLGLMALPLLISLKAKKYAKYLIPISGGFAVATAAGYITQYLTKDPAAVLGRGASFKNPMGASANFRKPMVKPMGASANVQRAQVKPGQSSQKPSPFRNQFTNTTGL